VLLVNSWQTAPWLVWLWRYRHPRGIVVHRVDGSGQHYGRADGAKVDRRLLKVNRQATLTVFQSVYARETMLRGPLRESTSYATVVPNPVDTEIFTPEGPRHLRPSDRPRVAVVGWSTNPRKGMASIWALARAHRDVHFVLIGRFDCPPDIFWLPHVSDFGTQDAVGLPAILRSCDALVTFAEREACPNHVLEAMACGLPVLYLDSGATRELVGDDAGLPVTEATFRAALNELCGLNGEIARKRALEFAPDEIFPRYLAAIREVVG